MSAATPTRFARASLAAVGGAMVWALHFGALYQMTALACARGDAGSLRGWILGVTAIAAGACVWLLRGKATADDEDLMAWLRRMVALLALAAIVWQALPAVLVARPCG